MIVPWSNSWHKLSSFFPICSPTTRRCATPSPHCSVRVLRTLLNCPPIMFVTTNKSLGSQTFASITDRKLCYVRSLQHIINLSAFNIIGCVGTNSTHTQISNEALWCYQSLPGVVPYMQFPSSGSPEPWDIESIKGRVDNGFTTPLHRHLQPIRCRHRSKEFNDETKMWLWILY
jgi:hypothetical protein